MYGLVHEAIIGGEMRPDLLPHVVVGSLFSLIGVIEYYGRNVPAVQRTVMIEQVIDLFKRGVKA